MMWPIDNDFDIEFVDQLAQQETFNKHLYRPNTYLHKWWARRCGTTFRAILKHLSDTPEFYTAGGLEGKIILDPMMGGGTTLHEAIRLGANVIGADIDPIPILQARATLSAIPLSALEDAFTQFHSNLATQLSPHFVTQNPCCGRQTMLRYTLYGQERACACGNVIVVDTLTVRQNRDGSRIHIDPATHELWHEREVISVPVVGAKLPLVEKRIRRCPRCRQKYRDFRDVPFYRRYVPLAIFGRCSEHGHFFKAPDECDFERMRRVERLREGVFDSAEFEISLGPKSQHLLQRGVTNYLDLFSTRQLLYLHHAIALLQDVDPSIRLNLALLVSTSLEFNAMLCGYKGWHRRRPGAIKHTFVRHAYSLPCTALENNPVYGSNRSGTLHKLFQSRIVRARQWAAQPVERIIRQGVVEQVAITGERDEGCEVASLNALQSGTHKFMLVHGNSAELDLPDASVDFVITDPPYFDSVQYGDLAEYFRVWLKQLLPEAFANWHYTNGEAAINQHDASDLQYVSKLTKIFKECHRVLKKENGRFVFTFHHWKAQGWAALTCALKAANFVLINRYVVQSESPRSVHIANQRALMHDVIFVCGSAETNPYAQWERPTSIEKDDSRTFCEQCGALVGYLLGLELDCGEPLFDTAEISTIWEQFL